jgi:hypothetical protein
MKKLKLRKIEYSPDQGIEPSEKDFALALSQFMFALENHQCPNCRARVRFDCTAEDLTINCPQGDYLCKISPDMLFEFGHFLVASNEISLLDQVTQFLDEIALLRGKPR